MSDKAKRYYCAIDLGAGSGRAMLGSTDGRTLSLQEVHRFPNPPVTLPDGLYWDVLRLWQAVQEGMVQSEQAAGQPLDGVAVDTWGVDYALLDGAGQLLGNPRNYRDPRTEGVMEKALERVPQEKIFESTGIHFMRINTLFQLYARVLEGDAQLAAAKRLLMTPDLLNYWLTGRALGERSIASTSQCYNPVKGEWADDILQALDIPRALFPELVSAGTVVGPLREAAARDWGVTACPVIAVGSHDTASAIAAVPLTGPGEACLSSGTWSLLGMEIAAPAISADSLRYGFTNEVGVGGTIRLLKNMTGLWLVQEMRRVWQAAGEDVTYDAMAQMAQAAPAFGHFVDTDHPSFMPPGDMEERIDAYCRQTRQSLAENRAARVRAAFESLVFKYRWALDQLERLTGQTIHTIHVVGGGTRNTFLNQWTANATGRTVRTGPVEATAAGNILMQMVATGQLESIAAGREMIRASFPTETMQPQDTGIWDEAYPRFCECVGLKP